MVKPVWPLGGGVMGGITRQLIPTRAKSINGKPDGALAGGVSSLVNLQMAPLGVLGFLKFLWPWGSWGS